MFCKRFSIMLHNFSTIDSRISDISKYNLQIDSYKNFFFTNHLPERPDKVKQYLFPRTVWGRFGLILKFLISVW